MRVLLAGGGTAGHTSPLLATADALRRLDPDDRDHLPRHPSRPGEHGGPRRRLPAGADRPGPAAPHVRRWTWSACRAGCAAAVRETARRPRPGPPRRRGRLRRLRVDAGVPRRPPPPAAGRGARAERRARPRQQGWAPGWPAGSRSASPTPRCRAPSTSGCRSAGWSPPSTGRRPRRGPGLLRARPRPSRPWWSPAARRAPAGSTSPSPAPPPPWARPACRCCTWSGPQRRGRIRRRPACPYVVERFVDRMDLALAAADLMVCRAGASSVTEAAAVGVPAIFVPLPHRQRRAGAQRPPGRRRRRCAAGRGRGVHARVGRRDACRPWPATPSGWPRWARPPPG